MSEPTTQKEAPRRRTGWLFVAGICVLAVSVRLVLLWRYKPWLDPNDFEYGVVARNILAGRGYTGHFSFAPEGPTTSAYPLYTLFLVLFYGIFPEPARYIAVMLTQVVVSAALAPVAYWVAARLFDRAVGAVAAGVVAVDYFLAVTPGYLTHITLHILLLSLAVASVVRLRDRPNAGNASACGVLVGLAALTKALAFLVLPAATLWLLRSWKKADGRRLVLVGAVWVIAGLVVLPWTVRNYLAFKRFVPVAAYGGLHLWVGNNPHATGGSYAETGRPVTEYVPDHILAEVKGKNEAEISDIFAREAFRWIGRNPGRFLVVRLKALFFTFFNQDYWMDPELFGYNPFLKWLTVAMMALAIPGAVVSWLKWPASRLLVGIVACYAVVYSLFHADVSNRFRLPLEPFLLMFAAALVVTAVRAFRRRLLQRTGEVGGGIRHAP